MDGTTASVCHCGIGRWMGSLIRKRDGVPQKETYGQKKGGEDAVLYEKGG